MERGLRTNDKGDRGLVPVYVDGSFSPAVPSRAVGSEKVKAWTDPVLKVCRTRKWKDWGLKADLVHQLLLNRVRVH